jgi:hypothetical protein
MSVSAGELRADILSRARTVVVKVGSAVLTCGTGLDARAVGRLVDQLSVLHDRGVRVVLVSSGAVAAGRTRIRQSVAGADAIDFSELPARQAASAIGQSRLMHEYDEAFGRFGKTVAQLLLTREDLKSRSRFLNARNAYLMENNLSEAAKILSAYLARTENIPLRERLGQLYVDSEQPEKALETLKRLRSAKAVAGQFGLGRVQFEGGELAAGGPAGQGQPQGGIARARAQFQRIAYGAVGQQEGQQPARFRRYLPQTPLLQALSRTPSFQRLQVALGDLNRLWDVSEHWLDLRGVGAVYPDFRQR